MAITGKKIVKEQQIIPASEVDEKACDICGMDATWRTPCMICKKDLCAEHLIDVNGTSDGRYLSMVIDSSDRQERFSGIYCRQCLIAEINKRFK